MNNDAIYYLCVFDSKNHALFIYTKLEAKNNNVCKLVSTPCVLKSGCTYSIKIPSKNYIKSVLSVIKEERLRTPKIYAVEKINNKFEYRELDIN